MTDLDQVREKIEDIVNTEEYLKYYEDNRGFLERWWDSVVEWFNELLSRIFGSISASNGFATGLVIVIAILVIMLVLLAIFFLLRHYRRKLHYRDRQLYRKQEKDWSYVEHLSEAEKQEANGNLQVATRHLFLALLLNFHERGYVEARISKTNWEYFEEIKQLEKGRAESFYKLARIFDDVVYGEQPVDSASYQSYKSSVLRWVLTSEQKQEEG